jgi:hypothetical protein
VLRKIFGPKGDETTGDRRRLHNEGLHDMYSSPRIFRVIESGRKSGTHGPYGTEEMWIQGFGGET